MNPTTTPTPNAQTPGPVRWQGTKGKPTARAYLSATPDAPEPFAQVLVILDGDGPTEADARLLAASYTMADAAGRALGVDAAALCERLDLAALIRAARHLLDDMAATGCLDHYRADLGGMGVGGAVDELRAALSALPPEPQPTAHRGGQTP